MFTCFSLLFATTMAGYTVFPQFLSRLKERPHDPQTSSGTPPARSGKRNPSIMSYDRKRVSKISLSISVRTRFDAVWLKSHRTIHGYGSSKAHVARTLLSERRQTDCKYRDGSCRGSLVRDEPRPSQKFRFKPDQS